MTGPMDPIGTSHDYSSHDRTRKTHAPPARPPTKSKTAAGAHATRHRADGRTSNHPHAKHIYTARAVPYKGRVLQVQEEALPHNKQ